MNGLDDINRIGRYMLRTAAIGGRRAVCLRENACMVLRSWIRVTLLIAASAAWMPSDSRCSNDDKSAQAAEERTTELRPLLARLLGHKEKTGARDSQSADSQRVPKWTPGQGIAGD